MDNWKPIRTAPSWERKEHTAYWVGSADVGHQGLGGMEPVRSAPHGKFINIYTNKEIDWEPTHWLELPTPPRQSRNEGL